MTEKTKNLGIRMTPEEHKRMRKLAVDLGKSVQVLVEEAVQLAYFTEDAPLSHPQAPPSPFGDITPDEEYTLRALLRFMREPNKRESIADLAIREIARMWGRGLKA